jgi:hypothetical protein
VARGDTHVPDAVERVGRKLKMEYVGMASVFTTLYFLAFSGLPSTLEAAIATAGTVFLFLGLKRKTRDHLCASFLLFAAGALAHAGVVQGRWSLPYMLFGMCVWAMEGYFEEHRRRIYALPLVLGAFAAVSSAWVLAVAFVVTYVLGPSPTDPGQRRLLRTMVGLSVLATLVVAGIGAWRGSARMPNLDPLGGATLVLYLVLAVAAALSLTFYWGKLTPRHRLNAPVLGALAAFDRRVAALFGMAAVVLLAATVFARSIDSDRWRPLFKKAEWYFFWVVLATALGLALSA